MTAYSTVQDLKADESQMDVHKRGLLTNKAAGYCHSYAVWLQEGIYLNFDLGDQLISRVFVCWYCKTLHE